MEFAYFVFHGQVMGRPNRLYLCNHHASDQPDALYWAISDRQSREFTIGLCLDSFLCTFCVSRNNHSEWISLAIGRDYDGVETVGDRIVASSEIYKLNGDLILKGEYEISLDQKTSTYSLRERFHEFEDLQSDLDLWNEYELTRISPHIIGNPDLEGIPSLSAIFRLDDL